MSGRLWRVAAGGLAGALLYLVLLLGNARLLIQGEPPRARSGVAPGVVLPGSHAKRTALIVLDAVRADLASNPEVMPNLVRLARAGGSGLGLVESLLPSTVAGIRALATGVAAPPLSIFEDFGSGASPDGGMFAAARAAGKRSFVVGPQLWVDLYGQWIDGSKTESTVGSDDVFLLGAALPVLGSRDHDLVVVHLGQCDEASHRFGGEEEGYLRGVRNYDQALGQLLQQIDSDTAVVVTSDHGVTPIGGHAGLERSVMEIPLVTSGPGLPSGAIGTFRQTEVPRLVLRALGVDFPEPVRLVPAATGEWALFVVLALLALAGGIRLWAALVAGMEGRGQALFLFAALAGVLLLAGFGLFPVGAALAAAALCVAAVFSRPTRWAWLVGVLGVAVAFGWLRLVDGYWQSGFSDASPTRVVASYVAPGVALASFAALVLQALVQFGRRFAKRRVRFLLVASARRPRWLLTAALLGGLGFALGGAALCLVYLVAIAAGAALGASVRGSTTRALTVGATFAFVAIALARALGETVSLSSTDVRAAYAIIDGPLGVGAASFVYALRLALPTFGLLLGAAPWLARASPRRLGAYSAGLAAALLGQALGAAFVLSQRGGDLSWTSLAVSAVLRAPGELAFFFVGMALFLPLGASRRRGARRRG